MGMTIEECLTNLKKLQGDYQQFHDDVWQDPESYGVIAESLRIGIDTMRKYQKIEDIYYQSGEALENSLRAVIEDGNK